MTTVVDPEAVSVLGSEVGPRCEVQHICVNGCCEHDCVNTATWRGLSTMRVPGGPPVRERFFACEKCHDQLILDGARRKTHRVIEWERL